MTIVGGKHFAMCKMEKTSSGSRTVVETNDRFCSPPPSFYMTFVSFNISSLTTAGDYQCNNHSYYYCSIHLLIYTRPLSAYPIVAFLSLPFLYFLNSFLSFIHSMHQLLLVVCKRMTICRPAAAAVHSSVTSSSTTSG